MAHNVVIKSAVAALNVDSFNRTAVFTADVDNGCVAVLNAYSDKADEGMVWKAEQATATSKGLWMATSPEVVITKVMDGIEYRGIVNDPRAFVNVAGHMVDMTYLYVGDIIEMTCEGLTFTPASDTYLVPDTTGFKLKGATAAGDGAALKKIGTSILHIGNGALAKTPVVTYKFVVEAN